MYGVGGITSGAPHKLGSTPFHHGNTVIIAGVDIPIVHQEIIGNGGEPPYRLVIVFGDGFLTAVAAGLGEFGLNRLLLTPDFGPRQRLVSMITGAPLVPEPLYAGPKLCLPDVCGQMCLRLCPSGALARTQSCEIGDRVFKYPRLNTVKCLWGEIHERGFQRRRVPMPSNPTWDDFIAAVGNQDNKDKGSNVDAQTFLPKCGACINFCPAPEFRPERIEYLKKKLCN